MQAALFLTELRCKMSATKLRRGKCHVPTTDCQLA